MKLYTESQVLNMLNMTDEVVNGDLYTYDEIIKSQTPIKLPSDEEIKKGANWLIGIENLAFREGAKWMKEQILNQNNNNERVTTDNDRVY